jgi:peptide/nickel transport system ATP-binding protein
MPEQRFCQYPMQFSGGMRQRIMIAMVLAAEPDVLIADEATTALDVTTQAQILELIRDLSKRTMFTVVIVTHNLGLIARYADEFMSSNGGQSSNQVTNIRYLSIHPIHTRAGFSMRFPRLGRQQSPDACCLLRACPQTRRNCPLLSILRPLSVS